MPTIFEIDSIEDLSPWESSWRALVGGTPQANFFHTWEWLTLFGRSLPETSRLRVFVQKEENRWVGAMPMVLCREQRRLGMMTVLTVPLEGWGTLFTPLGAAPQQVLTQVLQHLHHARRDWSILALRWLDERDGQLKVDVALDEAGWRFQTAKQTRGVLVDCRGTWDDYWGARPKKWRHNLERVGRKLRRELATPRFQRWRGRLSEPERSRVWELCLQVARRSWQAHAGHGVPLSDPAHQPFLKSLHATACDTGHLDAVVMFLEEKPVAFGYNLVHGGRVSGFRIGYDQAYRNYGVGLQLAVFALQDSFQRGDEWFDLGIDYLGYKRHLETHEYIMREYEHYSSWSLRGQVLRCSHALQSWWASPASESVS